MSWILEQMQLQSTERLVYRRTAQVRKLFQHQKAISFLIPLQLQQGRTDARVFQ